MIRSELVARIARAYPHLYLADVKRAVDTIFGEIANALAERHRVELRNFGTFNVKTRQAGIGRNPATGEAVSVAAKQIPKFKASRALRRRVNGGN